MADTINDLDRALIDAALAEGRVTRCAPAWWSAGLGPVMTYREGIRSYFRLAGARRRQARMDRIRDATDMARRGADIEEIADRLACSEASVRSYLRHARTAGML